MVQVSCGPEQLLVAAQRGLGLAQPSAEHRICGPLPGSGKNAADLVIEAQPGRSDQRGEPVGHCRALAGRLQSRSRRPPRRLGVSPGFVELRRERLEGAGEHGGVGANRDGDELLEHGSALLPRPLPQQRGRQRLGREQQGGRDREGSKRPQHLAGDLLTFLGSPQIHEHAGHVGQEDAFVDGGPESPHGLTAPPADVEAIAVRPELPHGHRQIDVHPAKRFDLPQALGQVQGVSDAVHPGGVTAQDLEHPTAGAEADLGRLKPQRLRHPQALVGLGHPFVHRPRAGVDRRGVHEGLHDLARGSASLQQLDGFAEHLLRLDRVASEEQQPSLERQRRPRLFRHPQLAEPGLGLDEGAHGPRRIAGEVRRPSQFHQRVEPVRLVLRPPVLQGGLVVVPRLGEPESLSRDVARSECVSTSPLAVLGSGVVFGEAPDDRRVVRRFDLQRLGRLPMQLPALAKQDRLVRHVAGQGVPEGPLVRALGD